MASPATEFADRVVALCRDGRHADALALADRDPAAWSKLEDDELARVCKALVTSGLRSYDMVGIGDDQG